MREISGGTAADARLGETSFQPRSVVALASLSADRLPGGGVENFVDPLMAVEQANIVPLHPACVDQFGGVEGEDARRKRASIGDGDLAHTIPVGVCRLHRRTAIGADDGSNGWHETDLLVDLSANGILRRLTRLDAAADQAPPSRIALTGEEKPGAVTDHCRHARQQEKVVTDA
jgi:hypothetical protein